MYLLDTCAFIWELHDDERISPKASEIIEGSDKLFLSIASLWEIAIKKSIGKLEMQESVTELGRLCVDSGITILPIIISYLETIQRLPFIHNDPFDRLIIATAVDENLILITGDSKIKTYSDIQQIW